MPQAVTRDEQWYELIVAELQGIKALLAELLQLLKTERKPDNEIPVS